MPQVDAPPDAPSAAEAQEDPLLGRLPRREHVVLFARQLPLLQALEVARNGPFVPPACGTVEGMRAWAQTQVGPACPVALIVLRLEAGKREVGDFVVPVPRGLERANHLTVAL